MEHAKGCCIYTYVLLILSIVRVQLHN